MSQANQRLHALLDARPGASNHLVARWLFLRALGLVYASAFFALIYQVKGLIGPNGILPAGEYLRLLRGLGLLRFWYAPTFLWFSSSDHTLLALSWIGLLASLLLVANVWPRGMLLLCFVCFLSFVSGAQDFSSYQSDGMLLEAGFLSFFLAPSGGRPGWGASRPAARAIFLLLLWEWFRIYFESGVVKLESGDPTWRNLTAMYEYYQNGPLPTWIGWYLQHLPHWFHIATAGLTLLMELVLVWMALLPGRWRVACFFIVTLWQLGVIATANYAFLNYLVLALAVLLLDDNYLRRFVPSRWRQQLGPVPPRRADKELEEPPSVDQEIAPVGRPRLPARVRLGAKTVLLAWFFYATAAPLVQMLWPHAPIPEKPLVVLEPFRIANQYGLFANMTPHRYEIEFQGSNDGQNWSAYRFQYKPQSVTERPRIYAPYQPRFDWNLWFASLGSWQQYPLVPRTEELLLENDREVLSLFADNPFHGGPPRFVRAVLWQYWFSTPEQKRAKGIWWRRELLGTYAPTLTRLADGRMAVAAAASLEGAPQP